jgi:hypothetical protein
VVTLIAISVIPLYLLITQVLFELDLNKLQNFCDDLPNGHSVSQVEAKVQGWTSLRLYPSRLADEGAKYVNVVLAVQPLDGWS